MMAPLAQESFEALLRNPCLDLGPRDRGYRCRWRSFAHAKLPALEIVHAVQCTRNTQGLERRDGVARIAAI